MSQRTSEQRKHRRTEIACPASVFDRSGRLQAKGRTMNLSDGGACVSVPIDRLPRIHDRVNVTFSVPRSTPNTYMLEEFASPADVVRHEPLEDTALVAVAIQFERPMDLALEV